MPHWAAVARRRLRESLVRVWVVDMLVAVRVLPLQALSLLLLPLPWTLPRLLSLQLASPASVVEGARLFRRAGEALSLPSACPCRGRLQRGTHAASACMKVVFSPACIDGDAHLHSTPGRG